MEYVDVILPKFRPLACVTAHRDNDAAWTDSAFTAEEKLDGARYMFTKDDRGTRMLSRHISVETKELVNKAKQVPHILRELAYLPSGTVLDGEICKKGKKSNYITHILGSLPPRAAELQRVKGYLDYVVFDMPFYGGKDLRNKPLWWRRRQLLKVLAMSVREHVKFIRNEDQNKENFYRRIIEEEDGEGIILKDLHSKYESSDGIGREKRFSKWKKVKKFQTFDCVIVGFTDPEKTSVNVKGETVPNSNYEKKWISGIILGQYVPKEKFDIHLAQDILLRYPNKSKTYKAMIAFCNANVLKTKQGTFYLQPYGVTVGMNFEVRGLLSRHKKEYLGSVCEVGAQERTETGSFRHPRFVRFRADKSREFCIFRENES
jgi:ATP-dependent DNA ligase